MQEQRTIFDLDALDPEKLTEEQIELIGRTIKDAMDVVLAVIISSSGSKEQALLGVEALRKDMIRNIEGFYEAMEAAEKELAK